MLVTGLPSCVEGIASAPDAVSLQSLMVTASPTISYVKRSALTSLIPQESNKTNTAKIRANRFFNCGVEWLLLRYVCVFNLI